MSLSAMEQEPDNPPRELLLTLDKAIQISKYSGWAWTLTSDDERICTGSGMFGYPVSNLWLKLKAHPEATTLYLSANTHTSFITFNELLSNLKKTNIVELNLPLIDDVWWIFDDKKDSDNYPEIDINYYQLRNIGDKLYYGPYTLENKQRPWVTCIAADIIEGETSDIRILENNFGYMHRIERRVLSSHALIFDDAFDRKPYNWRFNSAGSELLLHKYLNQQELMKFFSNLVELKLSTAVIIVNYSTCLKLLNLGVIDELFLTYHLLSNSGSRITQVTQQLFDRYSGWTIKDSHTLSLGVQVELLKMPF